MRSPHCRARSASTCRRSPKTSASTDSRHALWLGPDEWLLIDENGADTAAAGGHGRTRCIRRSTSPIATRRSWSPARRLRAGNRRRHPHRPVAVRPSRSAPVHAPCSARSRVASSRARRAGAIRVECWRSFAPYALRACWRKERKTRGFDSPRLLAIAEAAGAQVTAVEVLRRSAARSRILRPVLRVELDDSHPVGGRRGLPFVLDLDGHLVG